MNEGTDTPTFKVLDHGYVKLVDWMGDDRSIIEAARMSTGRGFVSWEPYRRCRKCDTVTKMDGTAIKEFLSEESWTCKHDLQDFPNGDMGTLDYLWRHKHATPFEMCELAIEVQAPLFVFREWHRHRTQSYNEFSARYSAMPNLHYVPDASRFEPKVSSNKQESSSPDPAAAYDMKDQQLTVGEDCHQHVLFEQDMLFKSYGSMLRKGVPKEVARINTPVSRYSKMRAKTDLRSWLNFLNLRMRPNAQWEIRQYAEAVAKLVKMRFPKTWSLFEEYDLYAASFGREEMHALRELLQSLPGAPPSTEAAKKLSGSKLEEFTRKIIHGGKDIL